MTDIAYLSGSSLVGYVLSFIFPLTMALSIITAMTENNFTAGPQFNRTINKLFKIPKKKAKKDMKIEDIKRAEKREKKIEKFNTVSHRLGYSYDYSESIERAYRMLPIALIVIVVSVATIYLFVGDLIEDNVLSGVIKFLSSTSIVGALIFSVFKPIIVVNWNKIGLDVETTEEISLLVSVLKNSGNRPLLSIFEDFQHTSDVLKKDIAIFLQDNNVFGFGESLNRMADRINLPIFYRVVNQLKALDGNDSEQRIIPLSILESEMIKELNNVHIREGKMRVAVLGSIMMTIAIAFVIIYVMPLLGDMSFGMDIL